MLVEYRPIVSSIFDRDFGRVSAEMSDDYRPSYWLSVGGGVCGVSLELSAERRSIVSVNTKISTECRPMVSADSVGRVSAEMSVEYRLIVLVNTRPRLRLSVSQ